MNEQNQEASAVADAGVEVYEWSVWRLREGGDAHSPRPVYEGCGTVTSENSYSVRWEDGMAERLVRLGGGPGLYLLLRGDTARRLRVVEETTYRFADDDE